MNVKSRFDTEDENADRREQYMRGMCATPLDMIAEATRMDASNIKGPKFLQRIFRALGWKRRAESKE
jgi:hypothetical protein